MGMCIGFLEYISIGKGIEAADLISKHADIEILLSAPNCPGRYQILFTGETAAVARGFAEGSAQRLVQAATDAVFAPSAPPFALSPAEQALFDDRVDLAVHSMKDLTVTLPDALHVAAILERADPRDAFVSNRYRQLSELPNGACVGEP